ncbi:hypothetical protein Ancab_003516 [Ancistrocladus abbreviatus]
MEREAPSPGLSPGQLLQLAERHLRLGNFSLSREYALETLQFDGPLNGNNHRYASQIAAVAEVLTGASETLGMTNWYSILQVETFCNDLTLIRSQFKKLILLLDPMKDNSQFANDALNLVWKAWSVLSNPRKKSEFDAELNLELVQQRRSDDNVAEYATFWTFCPYCFYVYEYASVYEGCCLRCQNGDCRRAFQGVSISIPNLPSVEMGKDDHVCCFGYFPMGYSGSDKREGAGLFNLWSPIVGMYPVGGLGKNGTSGVGGSDAKENFVEISDESDESESPGNGNYEEVRRGGVNFEDGKGKKQAGSAGCAHQGNGRRMTNQKMVARSTKKILGSGGRYRINENVNMSGEGKEAHFHGFSDDEDEVSGIPPAQGIGNGDEGGYHNCNVEFFEQDGEIFVALSPGAF